MWTMVTLGLNAILQVDHPASYKKVLNEPIRENLLLEMILGDIDLGMPMDYYHELGQVA